MRDYFTEYVGNQVPKVTKRDYGTNGTWFPTETPEKKDEIEAQIIDAVKEYHSPRRIDDQNAVDAYMAKLARVRSDAYLSAQFDMICEERIAVMVDGGSTLEEAEAYVSDITFLTNALLHV